ncbi:MAG: hypothetical protein FLDDKLPJ_01966 [Phycisphaerae bacterium]|nr:hypothetical protein [Phycisphaerae bacterium]
MIRILPRGVGLALIGASLTTAVLHAVLTPWPRTEALLERIAGSAAGAALSWSVIHAATRRADVRRRQGDGDASSASELSVVAGYFLLGFGVCAGVGICVGLALRGVSLAAALSSPATAPGISNVADAPSLWPSLLLLLATLLPAGVGVLPRVIPLWTGVAAALTWALDAVPSALPTGEARYACLLTTLARWQFCATVLVAAVTLLEGAALRRRNWSQARSAPWKLSATPDSASAGLRTGCCVLALTSFLALAATMVLPVPAGWTCRAALPACAVCAILCGLSLLTHLNRSFGEGLAEIGLALISLGCAAVFQSIVPARVGSPSARYAMVFNALMAGFAFLTWLWGWLAGVWMQQLRDREAWTTAGRMIPLARRFSFACSCVTLLCGGLLALWPRFPGVASADDTLGRFAAGVGVNFFALLVFVGCARRGRRPVFHLVVGLGMMSLLGFVAVRMLPFSAR